MLGKEMWYVSSGTCMMRTWRACGGPTLPASCAKKLGISVKSIVNSAQEMRKH